MSPDERLAAVSTATDHRLARFADKRAMRRRDLRVSALVAHPPTYWETALLYDVLLSAPRFGVGKLRAFNAAAMRQGVNVCAPLHRLPPGQRAWTVEYLRERGL